MGKFVQMKRCEIDFLHCDTICWLFLHISKDSGEEIILKMALQMNRIAWIRKLWKKSSTFDFACYS